MIINYEEKLILVVDDQEPVRTMLRRILENEGFQVRCVGNGRDAVTEATAIIPDLILLDIMMPGISGLEVIKILQQQDTTAAIPIILITAKDTPADIAQGFELGALNIWICFGCRASNSAYIKPLA